MVLAERRLVQSGGTQLELFSSFKSPVTPKGQVDLMSRAWFSLSKSKRTEPIEHVFSSPDGEREERIRITGSQEYGLATIWDKDLLLFIISQWLEAQRRAVDPSRAIHFTPYEFFKWQGKKPTGSAYAQLKDSLRRLQTTTVETTIRTESRRTKQKSVAFSWVSQWETQEEGETIKGVVVVVAEWLYTSVQQFHVLTLSSDYFELTGGVERWLYLYARKAAGAAKYGWHESFRSLHRKSGVRSPYKRFAQMLREIVGNDALPEFHLLCHVSPAGADTLYFHRREGAPITAPALRLKMAQAYPFRAHS